MLFQLRCQRGRPETEKPVIRQHCRAGIAEEVRQSLWDRMGIDGGAQNGIETVVQRMGKRGTKSAQRPETGFGPVGQGHDAGFGRAVIPRTQDHLVTFGLEARDRMAQQRPALP